MLCFSELLTAYCSLLTAHCSLASSSMTTMAKLVGVERARSRAGARADQRAFPAAREAADACAAERRPGHRQLVAMLLPESPSMTTMTYGLRRSDRPRRENQSQSYQETRQKLLHEILPFRI